jgi:hypothetical protein
MKNLPDEGLILSRVGEENKRFFNSRWKTPILAITWLILALAFSFIGFYAILSKINH